jgi:hypothetical protein
MAKRKRTNNDLQNIAQKIKNRVTRTPIKTGLSSGCSGRVYSSSFTSGYHCDFCSWMHMCSWHGLATPPLFFYKLSVYKFIFNKNSFIISSLFPYFNLFVSIFIQSYANNNLHVSTLYRYSPCDIGKLGKYQLLPNCMPRAND